MDYREALKWATYYHAVSLGAAAVGLALVGIGAFFGLRGSLAAFAGEPPLAGSTWAAAIGAVDPVPLLLAVPLGVLVWRVGRTTARLKATAAAADAGVDIPAGVESGERAHRDTDELADRTDVDEPSEAGFAAGTGLGPGPNTDADAGGEAESGADAPAAEPGQSAEESSPPTEESSQPTEGPAAGGATMAFGDDAGGDEDERATLEHADDAGEDDDEEFVPFEEVDDDEDR